MLSNKQEIFNSIELISIFFILLVAIIIITAIFYHNKKRVHKIAVDNYENALIRSQYEIQEQTMQTIGADLHDNIGQLLSLTSLTLGSIEIAADDKVRQKIDAALTLTRRSIKEMRLLGKLLQGEQLVANGLTDAIQQEINWMEKSGRFEVGYSEGTLKPVNSNPDKDLVVFRILQETLNNIIKHASATLVTIELNYPAGNLVLKIADNGVGFVPDISPGGRSGGMGLRNMTKRADIIGGKMDINSNPGNGTEISIVIPYP
jgi:signal transduction histidine kinase